MSSQDLPRSGSNANEGSPCRSISRPSANLQKMRLNRLRLLALLATFFIAPGAATAFDIGDNVPGYVEACRKIGETELIDGAIKWFVDVGSYYRSRPGDLGLSDINPYPYATVAEFKARNPGCCQVLPHIPGDFPPATQKLGEEYDGYRPLFAVKIAFLENTRTGLKKRYDTLLINCFGQRPRGD